MISKDQSIVTQVAAKIASELTCKTDLNDGSMANIQSTFLSHFDFVNEVLQGAHGNSIEHGAQLVQEAFPDTTVEEYTPAPRKAMIAQSAPMMGAKGSVEIAGKQHGDLPNWLITACQKAGVGRVWDNRDQAVGTKRPWFKQADTVDGQEAVAFWPPKGSA
jgi:hypothetical protein